MDLRNNLFGKGPRAGGAGGGGGSGAPGLPGRQGQRPSPAGYAQPPTNYDGYGGNAPQDGYGSGGGDRYGGGSYGGGNYGGGGYGGGGARGATSPGYQSQPVSRQVRLRLAKVEDKTLQQQYIYGNLVAVSLNDFPPNRDGTDLYIRLTGPQLRGDYVVTARPTPGFPDGAISLSDPQRTWCGVGLMDELVGEVYDAFSRGPDAYAAAMDVEVSFASLKKIVDAPYDQDELAKLCIARFQNQLFAPGQRLLLDVKNIPLLIVVKTVTLMDISMQKPGDEVAPRSDPTARGILTTQTAINFFKDAKSPIKLKGSNKRAAANAIISPGFKFEDMGIGGLDNEFSTIFRRAFASRIFPPSLIERMGISHVRGLLLYGPPGTGKTLIARQIGKMLNAREPKIINGPEVLNKYVGASEENIRKLFADAEKEYKEKGDESGLHIIIFDELDAVCKQRGSGAGGGTGVGDSVVNQLLSKLDGVEQLNNILLIGMTNRKDMIDDALLRPGRLEVQVEISLPDEFGRSQILKIHTAKMKESGVMADDVDIAELAALCKNYSGAELSGLVKSATSFAFARNTKVGTMAAIGDDIENMQVTRDDFMHAVNELQPAFGADENDLEEVMPDGIIHFSPHIESILNAGSMYVEGTRDHPRLRLSSVLLHGPTGSGKTALAAHIALKSNYPFIKLITPESIVGFRDEFARKDHLHRLFTDAYKSPLSMLIIDNIERIIEWNPIGARLSSPILQALLTLVQARPPKGHRLFIIGTTSKKADMDQLGVTEVFRRQIEVPSITSLDQLGQVLSRKNVSDVRRVLETVGQEDISVGIKSILEMAAETEISGAPPEWLGEQIGALVAAANTTQGQRDYFR